MNAREKELLSFELNDQDVDLISGGVVFPLIPLLALGVASAALGYQVGRDLARK
ncbi:MAG: hypothetical protein Q4G22_13190 [Paracoccus sp. (in: a-proteobacteria)]|uniref:hypothetical protein n=1 Tax=Paracoccus sp. TaxID=267 RepID=UPI0026DFEB6D|nr:hypothetical protein [Paracoccus sp. (in: a-proteobacteria)]MDO5632773.1 hypothetical protein [Paracoccus sp. (in: a-proteobacteria)]